MDAGEAAGPAARALQEWYAADDFARRMGLYSHPDPALDVRWALSGQNLAHAALLVSGQRRRVQDMARWWDSANALTALIDYMAVTGDHSYLPVLENTFARAPLTRRPVYRAALALSRPYYRRDHRYAGFLNAFYDDEGWWALAWLAAFDLTGERRYLEAAGAIFTDLAGGWDDYWDGGIYWGKHDGQPDRLGLTARPRGWRGGYKNAIANELFIAVAAGLTLRSGGDHLQWASQGWDWFRPRMINEAGLVRDSPNLGGLPGNSERVWSYNQGVILGGLCDLARLTGEASYTEEARQIADAFLASRCGHDSGVINGILHECDDCGPDGGPAPRLPSVDSTLFKGIFVRNLARLYENTRQPSYRAFIQANVDSALAHADPRCRFGSNWAARPDTVDFVRQTAGLDLINAELRVR
jgi:predicted alpha-1,6-mannanase (GH76 family)